MRECGDCQLCCRVMPIGEIGKPAGQRCGYQKFKVGCSVHGTLKQPMSCKLWKCWWLTDPTFDLPRPDRAGYVVDTTPDFVVFGDDVFNGKRVTALQIWTDEKRPEAWGAAEDWIKKTIGDKEMVCVIRFGSNAAITFVPPKLSPSGEWQLIDSRCIPHRVADNVRAQIKQEAIQPMAKVQNDG